MARWLGADHVVDFSKVDPVAEILRLTGGRGVDVAVEALGTQGTFGVGLRVPRPGGTLSSLGVCSSEPTIPAGAFAAGLDDIEAAYALFANQRDGVFKVAITP